MDQNVSQPQQTRAYLYGLSAVLLWSTVASAFKLSLRYLEPLQLLLYANAVSLLVLGLVLLWQGNAGELWRYRRPQYLRSLALGFLNPFLYYLVLFKAYELLPAQEAQPLNYTWAFTLALLSVPLLRQPLRGWDLLAGAVSYAGVVVIATRGDVFRLRFSDPLGVALALGSTVIWALYWIYNTRDDREAVAALFLNFLCALPMVLLACWLLSVPLRVHPYGLLGAAYVGICEMGITFVCWLRALRLAAAAARIGYLIFLSPLLSLLFIHLLVGETIRPSTLVGLGLILTGLLLQRRRSPA
ncbi:MAG: membrane protein [Candidatus Tectimicrobiota bacterium]|nr:MAG: membrane protein [Candidatus Tectomicrobia bacterium]